MDITIEHRPGAAAASIRLANQEQVTAEVGGMICMDCNMTVQTTSRSRGSKGGMLKGLKRMFSGESFFLNHFTATADDQTLVVGPSLVGDVIHRQLDNQTLIVQGSSWLASGGDIEIDTTWSGLTNAIFSREGIFWVKCSGSGDLLINSFGAIYEIDVDGSYTVDGGHIVAFDDTLSFRMGKAGSSLIGSFLGGEGLVCKFSGHGKLYCQTHNPSAFGRSLGPKLKPR